MEGLDLLFDSHHYSVPAELGQLVLVEATAQYVADREAHG